MSFYEDMEKSLLEAIEIEKGNIPLKERKGMSAPTYYISDNDKKLVENLIAIRKKENISQKDLAEMTGNSQQAISRFEQQTHSPSLKMFTNIVHALGYELKLVKQNTWFFNSISYKYKETFSRSRWGINISSMERSLGKAPFYF